jgi:cell division protein FtsL
MFCTNCGKEVIKGSKFCSNCGYPISNRSLLSIWFGNLYNIAATKLSRLRQNNKILFIIIFLLLIIFISFISRYYQLKTTLKNTQQDILSLQNATSKSLSEQQDLLNKRITDLSNQISVLKKTSEDQKINSSYQSSNNAILSAIAPSVVKIVCYSNSYSNALQQGSGFLFHSSQNIFGIGEYFIQTNLHVVQTDDGSVSQCGIALYPDYSNTYNYLVYMSSGYHFYKNNIDIAYIVPILVDKNKDFHAGSINDLSKFSREYSSDSICNNVSIGEHVSVLGYPAIGGSTLTITDGIVSGIEYDYPSRFIKTSAKIDQGDSGGIVIKDSGCLIGIPTFAETGNIESIGRILDLRYLINNKLIPYFNN